MDEKIKTWTLRFPPKGNPNMEKALFDWLILLQYDVTAKYRLIFRKFLGMKFFHPRVRLTNQKPRTSLCPFDKPIKSLYFRSFVVSVLFARFHFKVIRKSLNLCIYIFIQEMIEMIKESVVLILHTHDGARVGMHCLWHGTTKVRFRNCCVFNIIARISWFKSAYLFVFQDRKVLIKSFKGYYVKICKVRLKCLNPLRRKIQIQILPTDRFARRWQRNGVALVSLCAVSPTGGGWGAMFKDV